MHMTRSVIAICVVALSLAAQSAIATERWHSSTIAKVYPLASGDFIIMLDVNAPNCTATQTPYHYYHVEIGKNGMTADGLKLMYSAALAAAAQNLTIYIVYDDSTSNCYVNRLQVFY